MPGHLITSGLAALLYLPPHPIEGQGNLFVAVELGDDGLLDAVLLAALSEAQAGSPRCQTVVTPDQPARSLGT